MVRADGVLVADRADVGAVVQQHGRAMLQLGLQLTGSRDSAQDLVQDVMVRLLRDPGPPRGRTASYYLRAVTNAHIDRYRVKSSTEVVGLPEGRETAGREDVPQVLDRDAIWRALQGLPPRDRTVLVLRYYLDHTDESIGEQLGVTAATVRSIATRARQRLRAGHSQEGDLS